MLEVYTISANTKDPGEVFYDRVCTFIKSYARSPAVQDTVRTPNSLAELVAVWQSYKLMIKWIGYLFMHLDGGVILINELLTLPSVALMQFHVQVYETQLKNLIPGFLLKAICNEREGELIDVNIMQEVFQVLSLFPSNEKQKLLFLKLYCLCRFFSLFCRFI
jgi:hypothetical protein